MNVFSRFLDKFRVDSESHETLREQARQTLDTVEAVRIKRERWEAFLPDPDNREFPVAGIVQRNRGAINESK